MKYLILLMNQQLYLIFILISWKMYCIRGNILDNFFNNLTEENINDAKLLTSDIEKIKK